MLKLLGIIMGEYRMKIFKEISSYKQKYYQGLLAAIFCSLIWGFLPIYWKSLRPISSEVIILYRVILMAVLCFIISTVFNGLKNTVTPIWRSPKLMITHFVSGILITANWSLYIWAVNANFVIQSCLGYFIEPLLVAALGLILFKEKLNKDKKIALTIAIIGLCVMLIGYKQLPLIALGLAGTFSVYAAIKRNVTISPIQSLFYETLFILPVALVVLIRLEMEGQGAFAQGINYKFILLMFSGILTALPLGLFSFAATRVSMVTLGISEYISQTISLILGIFVFLEPFDIIQFVSFLFIWIALVFFTKGEIKDANNLSSNLK